MAKEQPWKDYGMKKAEWLSGEVAKAVNAGYEWDCETVDFSVSSNLLSLLTSFLPGLIDGNIQYEHGVLRG